jgi:adenine-specific DNA-methyltransferase
MLNDGSNFLGRQVFFLRRREGRFQEMAHQARRPGRRHSQEKAEQTLHIKLDGDAWERLYSFQSHPIPFRRGKRVVLRVISQFGEGSTWVLTL